MLGLLLPGCDMEKKQVGGETDLFALQITGFTDSSQAGTEGRKQEVESLEEPCFLVLMACSLSYATQNHLPRSGATQCGLGSPTPQPTKCSTDTPARKTEATPQLSSFLPACVKLTKVTSI